MTDKEVVAYIDEHGVLAFLKTKPEKLVYPDCGFDVPNLMNNLTQEEMEELFTTIDDDVYRTRLLLSKSINDLKEIMKYFPADGYLRTQIICTKHKDAKQSIIVAENKIRHYQEVKDEFLSLPESERVPFLVGLKADEIMSYEDVGSHRDNNEIKKSLLVYLEKQEDRDKAIESLERFVESPLRPYVELSEKMIGEFFDKHGGLSRQEEERIRISFKSTDFLLMEYENPNKRGDASFLEHYATIGRKMLPTPGKTLFVVLHEMMHVMSNENWRRDTYHATKTFEEGMADVVPQLIFQEYSQTHGEIHIGEKKVSPDEFKNALNRTGYALENGWLRTVMYSLQKQGKDYEGIREYLLGNKGKFFELALGKNFIESCEKSHNGEPEVTNLSKKTLLDINAKYLQGIDQSSVYYDMNFVLPAFVIQDRYGRQVTDVLSAGRAFNKKFINTTCFNERKLYEISYEEYAEFSRLYSQAYLGPKARSICGKDKYIISKHSELDDKQIEEHGIEIVGALAGLLQDCKETFDVETKKSIGQTLLRAIRSTKEQARKLENKELLIRLYENLEATDKRTLAKVVPKVALMSLEKLQAELVPYVTTKKISHSAVLGARVIEVSKQRNIDLTEVKTAGEEFDKDMTRAAQLEAQI